MSTETTLLLLPPIELTAERALTWLEEDGPQLLSLVRVGFGMPGPRGHFDTLSWDIDRMLQACAQVLRSGAAVTVVREHEPEPNGVGDFENGAEDLERLMVATYKIENPDHQVPVMAILATELGARRAMIEAAREHEGRA